MNVTDCLSAAQVWQVWRVGSALCGPRLCRNRYLPAADQPLAAVAVADPPLSAETT